MDGGEGCVLPSDATIQDGTYAPLSRPLYVYVRHSALEKPQVRAYVDFMLENAPEIVQYTEQMQAVAEAAGGAG